MKCVRMRNMGMKEHIPQGRASADPQVPQESRAWGLAATWLHATAASHPGNMHTLWAGAGGSELPSAILQCPAGTPCHQPPSSSCVGPARATVRHCWATMTSATLKPTYGACPRDSQASQAPGVVLHAQLCRLPLAARRGQRQLLQLRPRLQLLLLGRRAASVQG